MALETEELINTLIAQCFPSVCDNNLREKLDCLLGFVRFDHHFYTHGTLRQVLIIAYLNPLGSKNGNVASNGRATIRLHLSNETVYSTHLTGNIEHALLRLESICDWLASRPYEEDAFKIYDLELSKLLNIGRPARDCCRLRLDRSASITPFPDLSMKMVCKMCLAALNALRADYGLSDERELPQEVQRHFVTKCSPDNDAIRFYLNNLNQAALTFIHHASESYGRTYNQLKVYNFLIAENGVFCRNRIQAMHELHWLLPVLSGLNVCYPETIDDYVACAENNPKAIAQINNAIDTGVPLFNAVARIFGVPRETVRWSRKMTLPETWHFDVRRMELLLRMLSWLPPEKRPQSEDEWHAMRELVNTLLSMFMSLLDVSDIPEVKQEHRYGQIVGRWLRELMRPDLLSAHNTIAHMKRSNNDLVDAMDYFRTLLQSLRRFCYHAVSDESSTRDPYLTFLLDWTRTMSLQKILGLSRQWHEVLQGGEDEATADPVFDTATQTAEDTWPAVLPQPLCLGTLTIVELVDTDSLIEEGVIMQHCVGTYSAQCMMGDRLIFSVRNQDGSRLSTGELHLHTIPLRVILGQHRARQNASAPTHCQVAMNELVDLLNRADRQDLLKKRHDFQQSRRRQDENLNSLKSASLENYHLRAESAAWSCIFGAPPEEYSISLASLYQRVQPR